MNRRFFLHAGLLGAAVLALSSCRKVEERLAERIRLEAVERIEPLGPTSAEVVVRVKNATRHTLGLEADELTSYCGESRVGTLVLQEPVEVPRRTTGSYPTRWRLKVADPLALYVLVRKVQAGALDAVDVSCTARGRGGPAAVKISRERMPLSEFLNTFGVSIHELENRWK